MYHVIAVAGSSLSVGCGMCATVAVIESVPHASQNTAVITIALAVSNVASVLAEH